MFPAESAKAVSVRAMFSLRASKPVVLLDQFGKVIIAHALVRRAHHRSLRSISRR